MPRKKAEDKALIHFWAILTSSVVDSAVAYVGEFSSLKVAQPAAESQFPGRIIEVIEEIDLKGKI